MIILEQHEKYKRIKILKINDGEDNDILNIYFSQENPVIEYFKNTEGNDMIYYKDTMTEEEARKITNDYDKKTKALAVIGDKMETFIHETMFCAFMNMARCAMGKEVYSWEK